jgi:hypothetical protein
MPYCSGCHKHSHVPRLDPGVNLQLLGNGRTIRKPTRQRQPLPMQREKRHETHIVPDTDLCIFAVAGAENQFLKWHSDADECQL